MKKKSLILLLLSISILTSFYACKKVKVSQISGFNVQEEITVMQGSIVELEAPLVTDKDGTLLDVWKMVTDGNGAYVGVEANAFTANDIKGYVIKYVVRSADQNSHEKSTKVNVTPKVGEIGLSAYYSQTVSINEEITIKPVCTDENATFNYKVTSSNGNEVTVTDGKFTLTEKGAYKVKITTSDNRATYEYDIVARNPMQKGEIETYDETWRIQEEITGGKRLAWQITDTKTSGLKDRFGNEGTFAYLTTNAAMPSIYLNPRADKEYYKLLAEEGYNYASMWVYVDCEKTHITRIDKDPNGTFHHQPASGNEGPVIQPKTWTEVKFRLVDSREDWYRSFVTCYDYYIAGMRYFLIDNSAEWNPQGRESSITIYITDMFATKQQAPEENVDFKKEYKVGETIDLSSACLGQEEYIYNLEKDGVNVQLFEDYKFTENGEYTLYVRHARQDLIGDLIYKISVTDDFSATLNNVIVERNGATNINLKESFDAKFSEVNGVTPTVSKFRVFRNGKEYVVNGDNFETEVDGNYLVKIYGEYEVNGTTCYSVKDGSLDVYSKATKYKLFDIEKLFASGIKFNGYDKKVIKYYEGVYNVGGVEKEMLYIDRANEGIIMTASPMYSKYYYQTLLNETNGANYFITFNYYLENTVSTNNTNNDGFILGYKKVKESQNKWLSKDVSLQSFVDSYDLFSETYAKHVALKAEGDANKWLFSDTANSTDYFQEGVIYGSWGSSGRPDLYLYTEVYQTATTSNAQLKSGKSIELNTENDLTEIIDFTLDGNSYTPDIVEIYFDGEWIAIENGVFNPSWSNKYQIRLTKNSGANRGTATIEVMVGETEFVATVNNSFNYIAGNQTFDIGAKLSTEYDYEYLVTLNGKEVDGAVTNGVFGGDLNSGAYCVTVFAIANGSEPFNKIKYYTLTIDYDKTVGAYYAPTVAEMIDYNDQNEIVLREQSHGTFIESSYLREYATVYFAGNNTQSTYPASPKLLDKATYGRDGYYIELHTRTDNKDQWALRLRAMHTKAYYEALLEENGDLALAFDFYVETTENVSVQYYPHNNTTHKLVASNTWHTVSISLSELIASWDNIHSEELTYTNAYKLSSILRIYYSSKSKLTDIYVGNFRIGYDPEIVTEEGQAIEINNSETLTYDLSSINVSAITTLSDYYDFKWTLTDGENKVIEVEEEFDTTEFYGEYTLDCVAISKFSQKEYVAYTTTVIISDGFTVELTTDTGLHLYVGSLAESFDLGSVLPVNEELNEKISNGSASLVYKVEKTHIDLKNKSTKTTDYTSKVNGSTIKGADLTVGYYDVTVSVNYMSTEIPYYKYTLDYDKDSTKVYQIPIEEMIDYDENGVPVVKTTPHGDAMASTHLSYFAQSHAQTSNDSNRVAINLLTTETYGKDGYFISANTLSSTYTTREGWTIYLMPIHSKAYYQALVTENANYTFNFDFYFDSDKTGISTTVFGVSQSSTNGGTWKTASVSLSSIVENWDTYFAQPSSHEVPYKGPALIRHGWYTSKNIFVGNFAITLPTA